MCNYTVELECTFVTSTHVLNQLGEEEKQFFEEYVQSIGLKKVNQKRQVLMKGLEGSKSSNNFYRTLIDLFTIYQTSS